MPLLVTSASGANGNGFGALLAFESDGRPRGTFIDDDRIADPRGLAVDPGEDLLFLNSGADRVLAISSLGRVFAILAPATPSTPASFGYRSYRGFGARSSAWQKGNAGMNIAHGEQHKGRVHPWLAKILFSEDRFLHGRSKQAA
jgi:hypothetical protein